MPDLHLRVHRDRDWPAVLLFVVVAVSVCAGLFMHEARLDAIEEGPPAPPAPAVVAIVPPVVVIPATAFEPEIIEAPPSVAELLAAVVCAECKGCAPEERIAIAHVALTRARRRDFPDDLAEVLTAHRQFASPAPRRCSPQLPRAPPRADGREGWSPSIVRRHKRALTAIRGEVEGVLAGTIPDPTNGATHFHAKRLGHLWPHRKLVEAPEAWAHIFRRRP